RLICLYLPRRRLQVQASKPSTFTSVLVTELLFWSFLGERLNFYLPVMECVSVCGEAPHCLISRNVSDSTLRVVREKAPDSANGITVTIPWKPRPHCSLLPSSRVWWLVRSQRQKEYTLKLVYMPQLVQE
ncbi:mCG21664, partial [Mus musculus]